MLGEANQGAGVEWVEVPEEQFFIFPAFTCVCAHACGVVLIEVRGQAQASSSDIVRFVFETATLNGLELTKQATKQTVHQALRDPAACLPSIGVQLFCMGSRDPVFTSAQFCPRSHLPSSMAVNLGSSRPLVEC